MAIGIERIGRTQDRLGESPVWSAGEGRLYWIDSLAGVLHRLDPETGAHESFDVPPPVGSFALRRDGGVILALRAISGPPDQLQRQMDQDMRQWRGIIKEKGLALD